MVGVHPLAGRPARLPTCLLCALCPLQVTSSALDTKLRDDLERLKKIR